MLRRVGACPRPWATNRRRVRGLPPPVGNQPPIWQGHGGGWAHCGWAEALSQCNLRVILLNTLRFFCERLELACPGERARGFGVWGCGQTREAEDELKPVRTRRGRAEAL